ncbi:MAG: GDSL-type esterase/lipase family protein [Tannerella sp.]|jgi:lysophospholipase L1-like esterase|nr:GDSL-type esterase/lipase family protein [Tannerella sp.]
MMKWKKLGIDLTGVLIALPVAAAAFAGSFYGHVPANEFEDERPYARAMPVDSVCPRIDFAVDSLCRIVDASHSLDAFLDELEMLLAGKDTVVNVVHLGDSHVQAGFYSGQIMRMLQETFGNAGRGWISPLKLAKSNEPKDYFITSSIREWEIGRCIQKDPLCPLGPGGMGIRTPSDDVDFAIRISPVNGAGYTFNRLVMYRDSGAAPMLPSCGDSLSVDVCWGDGTDVVADTFRIAGETDGIHLHAGRRESPATNCYYGFSLSNGRPGILYHAVGQNGAMFANYSRPEYVRRLAALKPSLLIITLGTNESFVPESRFHPERFVLQMDSFVRLVKHILPGTAILITTPAESFRRVRKRHERNRNILKVATAICEYAGSEGIACFDMYGATGGVNSCEKWKKANLLGRDRIHYSIDGYCEQGKLLYKSLIRLKLNQPHETYGGD